MKSFKIMLSFRTVILAIGTLSLLAITPLVASAAEPAADEPDLEEQLKEIKEKFDGLQRRVKDCGELPGRAHRLICFDNVAETLGVITEEDLARREQVINTIGFWEITTKKNAVGEETWYLKNDAVEEANLTTGVRRIPTLVITCKNGTTDVYIDWKAELVNPAYGMTIRTIQVGYQFEDSLSHTEQWEVSTDRRAAFAPDSIQFIRRMKDQKALYFYFAPFNQPQQTIIHDISGFDKVLDLLVRRCYN